MPADVQRACLDLPPLKRPVHASAGVLINAAAGPVWEAVHAPESARLIHPEHIAYAGHIPGTPEREIGEMQYGLERRPGGRLIAAIHVVRELTEQHRAVTQRVGPPHEEVQHLLTPVPGGTRLELTCRWPARAFKSDIRAGMEKNLQKAADGFKAIIEKLPDGR
jgi:hypothetical protein